MKRMKGVLTAVAAVALAGCCTNHYGEFYAELDVPDGRPSGKEVELRAMVSPDEVKALTDAGYVMIGHSSFQGPYEPLSLAIDVAEERGADLVLANVVYRETKEYQTIEYVPSYSTYYSFGYGHGRRHGPRAGSTTVTTYTPVQATRQVAIYNHDAMFFARVGEEKGSNAEVQDVR